MTIQVEGLKENLRLLQKIDPALRREFTKRFKELAKPAVDEIEKAKPSKTGLPRGFQHGGRTGANTVKKVKVNLNTRRARARNLAQGVQYETIGTVRIQSADAATAIADMAGKTGNIAYDGYTRSYPGRPNGHRNAGQGAALIQALNASIGAPSRFMWPGAERGLTGLEQEFLNLAIDVEKEINRELMKIGSTANEIRAQQRGSR